MHIGFGFPQDKKKKKINSITWSWSWSFSPMFQNFGVNGKECTSTLTPEYVEMHYLWDLQTWIKPHSDGVQTEPFTVHPRLEHPDQFSSLLFESVIIIFGMRCNVNELFTIRVIFFFKYSRLYLFSLTNLVITLKAGAFNTREHLDTPPRHSFASVELFYFIFGFVVTIIHNNNI